MTTPDLDQEKTSQALVSDITLRKQIEARLRESEELFHIQVEAVQDYAIFMLDAQGNVLNWNAGAERLKGYKEKEIIGTHFSCFYPEEDQNAGNPAEELKKAAAEGRVAYEGWRIRKNGSRFWADVIITALYDESANLRGFSMVTHDITERKKAEDALRFSEARYRTLFRDNPTMLVTLDTDMTMLSVNPACASQLGYTIDELEGRSVLKLFHEDDRPAVAGQLRICLQSPNLVYRWQFRKIRKDGELLWVEETAQAVYDVSGVLNILIVCQDVTARKRLEDELKKTSMQNELILASAGEGIIGLDLEGNQTFVNASAAAMLGHDVNDLVGKSSHSTWHYVRPDGSHYSMEKCPIYAAYKDGTVHSGEEIFLRKDGTSFPVQFTSRPVLFDGKIVGAVLTFNDISERKRAEEEIARLNADLAARAVDLEYANRELEAFNYSVAHDLRNPLNVISSYCQVFKELCGAKLDENCMRYIQETYDGTLRMNRLIEALLNFSQLAHAELNRDRIDLSSMAREVAAELKGTDATRHVEIRIADWLVDNGDPNLLRVVLNNLIGNAWKYTSMREEAVIEFGAKKIDGKPVYFVRDNGNGFDQAAAEKIFAPFQRLPGPEESRGFGIGLATVERIIRRHGGRVCAEGEPDKGATFYFTLSADDRRDA